MTDIVLAYDKKYLFKCLFRLALVIGAMYVSGGVGFVMVIPLMFVSFSRRQDEDLFFWLMVMVTTLICNSYFAPKGVVYAVAQRGLLVVFGFIMSVRVFGTKKPKVMTPFAFILVYVLFMIFPSFDGWSPLISFLKLFLFTVIYFAYFGIALHLSKSRSVDVRRVRSVILTISLFFIIGSIVLIPFPAISQVSAEERMLHPEMFDQMISLFKGMTMQSQCLGPIVSVISVALLSDLLFGVKRADRLYILLLVLCPILIYKTSSRTGMISYLVGMLYSFFLFLKARGIRSRWRSRVISAGMFIIVVLAIVVMASSKVSSGVMAFALKTAEPSSREATFENMTSSRQGLIDLSMENFRRKPLFGNGFQVMEYMVGNQSKSLLTAPIEKGFWPTAVLEEGGVIGFTIFVVFLLSCLVVTARNNAPMASACLFVYTLANCGEFTFFSLSYVGGFAWAVIFAALILDLNRNKQQWLMGQ